MDDQKRIDIIKRGNSHHKTLDDLVRSVQADDMAVTLEKIDTLMLFLKVLKFNIRDDEDDKSNT